MCGFCGLAIDNAAVASHAAATPRSDAPALGQAVGVQHVDGSIWALGPGYKARFDARGVELIAVLGSSAPPSDSFTWSLETLERGAESTALAAAGAAPRMVDAHTVAYARAVGVEERYEARVDGIEWSVLLASKPTGRGDLELIYSASELPVLGGDVVDTAVRFGLSGGAWIRVSDAWAIDARGARTPVHVLTRRGALVLRIAAADVDAAVFPLLVDPLVSVNTGIAVGAQTHATEPRIAWADGLSFGLAVWQEAVSAVELDVRGRLVQLDGAGQLAVVGDVLPIEIATGASDGRPDVIWGASAGAFLVVAERRLSPTDDADIRARTVRVAPVSGADPLVTIGAAALVSGIPEPSPLDPGDELAPTLGAHATLVAGQSRVVLGYEQYGDGVRAAIVAFSGSAAPQRIGEPIAPSRGHYDQLPRLSRGSAATCLLCWQRFDTDHNVHSVHALLVGFDGVQITTGAGAVHVHAPAAPASTDDTTPDAAGDGTEFAIAFARGAAGARKLELARVRRAGPGSLELQQLATPAATLGAADESEPALLWNGREYGIAWTRASSSGTAVIARTLDPIRCLACQSAQTDGFGGASGYARENASGAAIGHDGLLAQDGVFVWQSRAQSGASSEIFATLVQGDDSATIAAAELGACTASGLASAASRATHCASPDQAAAGALRIVHRLADAAPTGSAFLLISPFDAPLALCSSCKLHPDLFTSIVVASTESAQSSSIDANGRASYSIDVNVPDPDALHYVAQWVVVTTDPPQCFGARFSNALDVDVHVP